jgi:hypothetical protein
VFSFFSKVTDQLINAGKLAEKKDNVTYLEIFESFKDTPSRSHRSTRLPTLKFLNVMMEEFDESMFVLKIF